MTDYTDKNITARGIIDMLETGGQLPPPTQTGLPGTYSGEWTLFHHALGDVLLAAYQLGYGNGRCDAEEKPGDIIDISAGAVTVREEQS